MKSTFVSLVRLLGPQLSLLGLLTCIYPSSSRSATFQNGSFETNDNATNAPGWTFVQNSGGDHYASTAGSTDGNSGVLFNSFQLSGNGILSQTFDTLVGQSYQVSFDFGSFGTTSGYTQQLQTEVRDGSSATSGTETISSNTGSIIIGSNAGASILQVGSIITVKDVTGTNSVASHQPVPTSPEFSAASFTFTALSTSSTLVFSDQTGSSGQFTDGILDNVQIQIVPEPSTAVLGAIGIFGIAMRRARGGRKLQTSTVS